MTMGGVGEMAKSVVWRNRRRSMSDGCHATPHEWMWRSCGSVHERQIGDRVSFPGSWRRHIEMAARVGQTPRRKPCKSS